MRIERLGPGDEARVEALGDMLDGPALADATARFLREPGHHLLVAYEGDAPLGFVTAVETTHPDKGTEMFLYELGVDEQYRRQGVARALLDELVALARAAGCHGMWVLTEDDNTAALAAYESAGARRDDTPVLLTWDLTVGKP